MIIKETATSPRKFVYQYTDNEKKHRRINDISDQPSIKRCYMTRNQKCMVIDVLRRHWITIAI